MGSEAANVSANSDVSGDAADHDRSRSSAEHLFEGSTLKHRTPTPKATLFVTHVEEIKLDRNRDTVAFL